MPSKLKGLQNKKKSSIKLKWNFFNQNDKGTQCQEDNASVNIHKTMWLCKNPTTKLEVFLH